MKRISGLLILLSVLGSTQAQAGTYEDAANAALAKNWDQARDLAAKASLENPSDSKAWYLLGVVEQRLGHPAEAADAFQTAARLAPQSNYGKSAATNATELSQKADQIRKQEFGRDSDAFFAEYSLIQNSGAANQLNASTPWAVSAGFKFGRVLVGFLYGHASGVNSIQAPAEGSALNTSQPANYTRINGSGSLLRREIFIEPEISLVKPYESWGPIALDLPLLFGGVENTVSLNDVNYGNLAYDTAAGLRASIYTKSPFVFTVAAMYHIGIPFWDIRHDSDTLGIKNTQGAIISGNNTGFELNFGIRLLFGSDVPEELKD